MTLEKVFNIILNAYELSKDHFFGPENRIYYLYLLSSLDFSFICVQQNKEKKILLFLHI